MRQVFVDTLYWLAITRSNDQWKAAATRARETLGDVILVTSDEVLTEFLNAIGGRGPHFRQVAVKMVRAIIANPNVRVVAQSRGSFLRALARYESRTDKTYSLTDCSSMDIMDALSIQEALTHDAHFRQEGFTCLIEPR